MAKPPYRTIKDVGVFDMGGDLGREVRKHEASDDGSGVWRHPRAQVARRRAVGCVGSGQTVVEVASITKDFPAHRIKPLLRFRLSDVDEWAATTSENDSDTDRIEGQEKAESL